MIKYFIIFIALFLTDIVWALYIRWSANGKALKAAFSSIFIYVIGAFTFGEFIKDVWVLVPASLGCFCGTYLTIWWDSIDPNDNEYHCFGNRLREIKKMFSI